MRNVVGLTLAGAVASKSVLKFDTPTGSVFLDAIDEQTLNLKCAGSVDNLCGVESRVQAFVESKISESQAKLNQTEDAIVGLARDIETVNATLQDAILANGGSIAPTPTPAGTSFMDGSTSKHRAADRKTCWLTRNPVGPHSTCSGARRHVVRHAHDRRQAVHKRSVLDPARQA
jgi:hypothetical protein